MVYRTCGTIEIVNFDSFLDIVNTARKVLYIGHAYTLREISKTHEEIHMCYNSGKSST
jgi:hypothetical protein